MAQNYSQELLKALAAIVEEKYVTADPIATFPYSYDASIFGGTEAAIVVRPGSTEEVSQLLKLANKLKFPVVVRGGGASIYGQPRGVPKKNVLLDMTRMNQVIRVNHESLTVTAQCGIIMGKLQTACKKDGFYIFAPFAPLHIVSLGGWMSGVAGGAGLWPDIVSITVVLADGTVVKTGGGPGTNIHQPIYYNRNLGGPDFAGLFIGDGGSFGIKTEATVRITKYPPVLRATIFEFDTLEKTLELVKCHVERVNPHPFDPIMVFGPGAMKHFMPDFGEITNFTAQGMMQGHTEAEIDVKRDIFNARAEELGGTRTPMLDAMADAMAASGGAESEMTMDWLALFNALGLTAWLPFTLPREGFTKVYYQLLDWRTKRLEEAAKKGFVCCGTWEFFTPCDPSSLIGEMDAFFEDTENPEVVAFARNMMRDFQLYARQLGSIDVYNQGFMADLNATCWSPGYRSLFQTVKASLDPNNILNPGLWTPLKQNE